MGLKPTRIEAIERSEGWKGVRDTFLAIINNAKLNGLSRILVFEDDIIFLERDPAYYAKVFSEIDKTDWHLLYLSATTHRNLKPYNDYLLFAEGCKGMHTIAFNQSSYDLILSNIDLNKKIDVFMKENIQPLGKSFISNILCTTQKPDYSDIEKKKVDYHFIQSRFAKYTKN